jgi:hypothetical protein
MTTDPERKVGIDTTTGILLISATLLSVLVLGCNQPTHQDLSGRRLPSVGAEVVLSQPTETIHLANDQFAMRDLLKSEKTREQILQESSLGPEKWNEITRQDLAARAARLHSEGKIVRLLDGTKAVLLGYYRPAPKGSSDYMIPLNASDKQAWWANVRILGGEHEGRTGIVNAGSVR